MQLAISQVNNLCEKLLDNIQLETLVPPQPPLALRPPLYSAKGVKNTRRHMEDRHIILDDFNAVFGIKASAISILYYWLLRADSVNNSSSDTDSFSYIEKLHIA